MAFDPSGLFCYNEAPAWKRGGGTSWPVPLLPPPLPNLPCEVTLALRSRISGLQHKGEILLASFPPLWIPQNRVGTPSICSDTNITQDQLCCTCSILHVSFLPALFENFIWATSVTSTEESISWLLLSGNSMARNSKNIQGE